MCVCVQRLVSEAVVSALLPSPQPLTWMPQDATQILLRAQNHGGVEVCVCVCVFGCTTPCIQDSPCVCVLCCLECVSLCICVCAYV